MGVRRTAPGRRPGGKGPGRAEPVPGLARKPARRPMQRGERLDADQDGLVNQARAARRSLARKNQGRGAKGRAHQGGGQSTRPEGCRDSNRLRQSDGKHPGVPTPKATNNLRCIGVGGRPGRKCRIDRGRGYGNRSGIVAGQRRVYPGAPQQNQGRRQRQGSEIFRGVIHRNRSPRQWCLATARLRGPVHPLMPVRNHRSIIILSCAHREITTLTRVNFLRASRSGFRAERPGAQTPAVAQWPAAMGKRPARKAAKTLAIKPPEGTCLASRFRSRPVVGAGGNLTGPQPC